MDMADKRIQGMKKIKLTQGKEALVDDEDYEMLMEHKWHSAKAGKNYYAVRSLPTQPDGTRKRLKMHRAIISATVGMEVDHINGNTLDNRKENLRECTHQQNQANRRLGKHNTSGYKGIYYKKKNRDMINEHARPWEARISFNTKKIYLGSYKTKEEAARAYDKKAIELFGQFAQLNFPEERMIAE